MISICPASCSEFLYHRDSRAGACMKQKNTTGDVFLPYQWSETESILDELRSWFPPRGCVGVPRKGGDWRGGGGTTIHYFLVFSLFSHFALFRPPQLTASSWWKTSTKVGNPQGLGWNNSRDFSKRPQVSCWPRWERERLKVSARLSGQLEGMLTLGNRKDQELREYFCLKQYWYYFSPVWIGSNIIICLDREIGLLNLHVFPW